VPVLELRFDAAQHRVSYRWKADEAKFAMPIEVGEAERWTVVTPVTTEWKTMLWNGSPDDFQIAKDLYYMDVVKE
jgi:hypothetical protein